MDKYDISLEIARKIELKKKGQIYTNSLNYLIKLIQLVQQVIILPKIVIYVAFLEEKTIIFKKKVNFWN